MTVYQVNAGLVRVPEVYWIVINRLSNQRNKEKIVTATMSLILSSNSVFKRYNNNQLLTPQNCVYICFYNPYISKTNVHSWCGCCRFYHFVIFRNVSILNWFQKGTKLNQFRMLCCCCLCRQHAILWPSLTTHVGGSILL